MKTFTLTGVMLALFSFFLISFETDQQYIVPDEIYSALKAGNSKVLSKYFNDNIELLLLNKEGVYSKTQAELVVRDFFAKNTPTACTKLYEIKSEKGNLKYVICKLYTAREQFRIYFVMKYNEGEFTIHQLRIENDKN